MRPTRESDPSSTATILVVDDCTEIRGFCNQILESRGYQVFEAPDGEEALEILGASNVRIDLVLTDVIMPRLNGVALADRLAKVSPQTPILYMSGYVEGLLLANRIPEELLLQKPFTPERLVAAIVRLLETKCA